MWWNPGEAAAVQMWSTVEPNVVGPSLSCDANGEMQMHSTGSALRNLESGLQMTMGTLRWLPHLGDSSSSSSSSSCSSFDLEKVVCSHGLFMMAPNLWDPSTKTLQRPLRLSDSTTSVTVRISSSSSSSSLHVRVLGTPLDPLSQQDKQVLLAQVARMLRLSDIEERNIQEFHKIHLDAKDRGFGRIFRSPTLFEDMVKCILLCNCQWPRTLAMAKALCELQLDLKSNSRGPLVAEAASQDQMLKPITEDLIPKTPIGRESKRRSGVNRVRRTNLTYKLPENDIEIQVDRNSTINSDQVDSCFKRKESLSSSFLSAFKEDDSFDECKSCHLVNDSLCDGCSNLDPCWSNGSTYYSPYSIGDFPSPRELASLDADYLAKRCNLGYRANRIVKLAQSIVEGRLQLEQLEEEVCSAAVPSGYDKLTSQLLEVDGIGPFTCANVLMCMGFYQVIPTDTETIRHLKKVHRISCTNRTVQRDVEKIYAKYEPFQFLAYWSELWQFYEETFGKTSEMPPSSYQLITASNMRSKRKKIK